MLCCRVAVLSCFLFAKTGNPVSWPGIYFGAFLTSRLACWWSLLLSCCLCFSLCLMLAPVNCNTVVFCFFSGSGCSVQTLTWISFFILFGRRGRGGVGVSETYTTRCKTTQPCTISTRQREVRALHASFPLEACSVPLPRNLSVCG